MVRFACVVLVDPRGWVLLQERDEHARISPDKWGLCGGHVDEGEEFLAGAVRELEEETGVRVDPVDLHLYGEFGVFHEETGSDDVMRFYAAATGLTDADIVCGEGRQIVFVDPATVPDLDLTTSAQVALLPFLDSDLYRKLAAAL